jgi:hypothetical protein
VEEHLSGCRGVQTHKYSGDRTLSAAAFTDQGDDLAASQREAHVIYRVNLLLRAAEAKWSRSANGTPFAQLANIHYDIS